MDKDVNPRGSKAANANREEEHNTNNVQTGQDGKTDKEVNLPDSEAADSDRTSNVQDSPSEPLVVDYGLDINEVLRA